MSIPEPFADYNFGIPRNCKACNRYLLIENLFVDDGCPCNSPRGVNFKPLECRWCRQNNCVKPGHHLFRGMNIPIETLEELMMEALMKQ